MYVHLCACVVCTWVRHGTNLVRIWEMYIAFYVTAHQFYGLRFPCHLCVLLCFRAKAALSQSCARIAAYFIGHSASGHSAPFTVPFKGVGSFSSSVVFACVDPSVTEVLQHLGKVAGEGDGWE